MIKMMGVKISSGLQMYRLKNSNLEVFLVHPGGPFWKNKDEGAWSIPKGEVEQDEELLETAKREFKEEIGFEPNAKEFIYLGCIKQKAGKTVYCWAFQSDFLGLLPQNFISVEYPPKSRKFIKIPEIDRAQFFSVDTAKKKINSAQKEFIDRLEKILKENKNND